MSRRNSEAQRIARLRDVQRAMNHLMPRQISLLDETAANVGFEGTLWSAADKLRGNMDASEYKHIVLGLIFLKYVSDADIERGESLEAEFVVPKLAGWVHIDEQAHLPSIGQTIDDAMEMLEGANPMLKDVLPRHYSRRGLDQRSLGEVVRLISTIRLGDAKSRSRDVLGRVYEYFLAQFASTEGKRGGEFYTPRCVVRLLVSMIAPYRGTVYDPCCGSGGMFVQSEKFVEEHGGKKDDIQIFGQESNLTTLQLARMNLAMRGIRANLGSEHANTFHNDLHHSLRASYILANPPFNDSDWGVEKLRTDARWAYGVPPSSNANYAWVQHFIHHLGGDGIAGFVLANGSLSSNQGGEGEIRRNIVEADLVDCIVSLPSQLFYSTQIPVSLWFIAKNKNSRRSCDRRGTTLFIDARSFGGLVDRVHRELNEQETSLIANAYRAWIGGPGLPEFRDIPGFAKGASLQDIRDHKYALVPGRYVGFSRTKSSWTIQELHAEIAEIEVRIRATQQATTDSWRLVEGLIHG